MNQPRRVAVIGNGGGGKSTLARLLAARLGLSHLEVDAIQFGPNWARTPENDVRKQIRAVIESDEWLIDGFGPYDTILERFARADLIVFIDHPLWVHYWWAMERQIAAHAGEPRVGGPDACDLRGVNREMCEAIWYVHTVLRPKLLVDVEPYAAKTKWIRSPEELDAYAKELTDESLT